MSLTCSDNYCESSLCQGQEQCDIFVLCTRGELSKYRVPNLIDTYHQHGMCVHHYPIPDGNAPDIATCCKILEELRNCLENNRKTMIHCLFPFLHLFRENLSLERLECPIFPCSVQQEF
uniref:protein-tyrosine-phosphatase n=1 Tax=Malurus cyaneus samueli TaxID=2593467 RepID=A0A8C5T818_9PASS